MFIEVDNLNPKKTKSNFVEKQILSNLLFIVYSHILKVVILFKNSSLDSRKSTYTHFHKTYYCF